MALLIPKSPLILISLLCISCAGMAQVDTTLSSSATRKKIGELYRQNQGKMLELAAQDSIFKEKELNRFREEGYARDQMFYRQLNDELYELIKKLEADGIRGLRSQPSPDIYIQVNEDSTRLVIGVDENVNFENAIQNKGLGALKNIDRMSKDRTVQFKTDIAFYTPPLYNIGPGHGLNLPTIPKQILLYGNEEDFKYYAGRFQQFIHARCKGNVCEPMLDIQEEEEGKLNPGKWLNILEFRRTFAKFLLEQKCD